MTGGDSSFIDDINLQYEQAFTVCAQTSQEIGCKKESLIAAQRVFGYNPHSRPILERFPQFRPRLERISKLIDAYGRKLKTESSNWELWGFIGCCYLAIGDFPNAFAAHSHVLRVHPGAKDVEFLYAVAVVYGHYSYDEQAIRCLEKVREYDRTFKYTDDVIFRLGLLKRRIGMYEAAIELLDLAMSRPPKHMTVDDVKLQIVYAYQCTGKLDRATAVYLDLHERFPNVLEVTVQYAWCTFLSSRGTNGRDLAVASRIVAAGLVMHPRDPLLTLIAARIAMVRDDMEAAYEHFHFCRSYYPDNPYLWYGLGVIYYRTNQTDDAMTAFKRAVSLKTDLASGLLNIGLILERQGDIIGAQKLYQTGQVTYRDPQNNQEFTNRLNSIANRRRIVPQLIDIDDTQFMEATPERFEKDYIAAVPDLPVHCLGVEDAQEDLGSFATFPQSYFNHSTNK